MALIPDAGLINIGEDIEIVETKDQPSLTYKIDFDNRRISGLVDEVDAVKQSIIKILQTERFKHLIYTWNYGSELKTLVNKNYQLFESELKRVISEALLEDERITNVYDIAITKVEKRNVYVTFVVDTVFGTINLETEVVR